MKTVLRWALLNGIFSAQLCLGGDPLNAWSWRNPVPTGESLIAVAYGNGQFIAVGSNSAIASSPDGATWIQRSQPNSGLSPGLYGIAYGAGLFVAVGESGTVLTSADGSNWTQRTSGSFNSLWGVAFGGGSFVAVGDSGTILVSPDGITWTSRSSGISSSVRGIAFGNGRYVAVGASGAVLTSSNGVTWAQSTFGATNQLLGVSYGNGLFVSVGGGYSSDTGDFFGTILTSTNGINWVSRNSPTNGQIRAVAFGNGQFVAAGSGFGNDPILSSQDGINWSARDSGMWEGLVGVTYGDRQFVIVGGYGTILTSQDATIWSSRTILASSDGSGFSDVAYGNNIFVAVGGPTPIVTSPDGITWTPRSSGLGNNSWGSNVWLGGITYANGVFVAVGSVYLSDNGGILTSTDGVNWVTRWIGGGWNYAPVAVAGGGGHFVAVGRGGTYHSVPGPALVTSSDGINWTQGVLGSTPWLSDVAYANGIFVAVGDQGTIITSSDGSNWTTRVSGTTNGLNSIAYGNGLFVASGSPMLTSPDGINWTKHGATNTFGYDLSPCRVRYENGVFILLGCWLHSSSDGVTWTPRYYSYQGFRSGGVAYGNGLYVVAADLDTAAILTAGQCKVGPSLETLPATEVATEGARLNGFIGPNGLSTTAYFEFGTTTAYGSTTAFGTFGGTSQDIGFALTGLTPGTTYHYRIVATCGSGITQGGDMPFTTLLASTTSTKAWVAGTGGMGLRLRASASLSAAILTVMPEGSTVTLLGATQTADGYLWRQVSFGAQTGWAASQYLIFAPPGTTPSPPGAPFALGQYLEDGATPIAAGATVLSDSVVLAATPQGPASQQFAVQFEVRPAGVSFSTPGPQSVMVRGGTQAQVTVGPLGNQGYHWRARVLDGSGVASSWVTFSANSTDFIVNALHLPSAQFTWNPVTVFEGDTVQFIATAAGQAGLTFNWDFGGGNRASGATASQTFAVAGQATVTLTVTDSQNHQSQHSEIITVVTKQLEGYINQLAQQTEGALDQLLAQAQNAAVAADYFQQGVSAAPKQLGISFAFGLIGAGMDLPEFGEFLQSSLLEVGAGTAAQLAQAATEEVLTQYAGQSYPDIFIPGLQAFISQKKTEIEQRRQQALAAAGSLTPAQAEQLARDLHARTIGNLALSDSYATKALLPVTFSQMQSRIQGGWDLAMAGGELTLTIATAGSDTLVVFLLAESANVAQTTLDQLNTLSAQPLDVQMLVFSLDAVGQARFTAKQMANNAENGLAAVLNSGALPVTPAGQMSVQCFAEGSLEGFAFARHWVAKTAYANVTVQNTGSAPTTYRLEASYPKTFTTSQLGMPFDVPGFSYRLDKLFVVDNIQLNQGEQRVLTINYLTAQGGEVPNGLITYTLTAQTTDGYYGNDSKLAQFSTTLIDGDGNQIDHSQLPDVLLVSEPVQSSIVEFGGGGIGILNISVQNPMETPLLLNLAQDLPPGTVVIDGAGGVVATNRLFWQVDLQPAQTHFFQVTLQLPLPIGQPPLTNTVVSVYDSVNGNWIAFEQAPVTAQVVEAPAPQLQAPSWGVGGFGMDLWAPVPGVHRVEATTDFSAWQPVMTLTNGVGAIHVTDSTAQGHPARFYRAVRQ